MRLAHAAAVLATAALLVGGCASDPKVDSALPQSSAGPGLPADVPPSQNPNLAANTKTVCAASKSALQSAVGGMAGPLAEMAQAVAKNDEAALKSAQVKLKMLFGDAASQLEEQSKVTVDTKLKSALVDSAAAYRSAGNSLEQGPGGGVNPPAFDSAGDEITSICGISPVR